MHKIPRIYTYVISEKPFKEKSLRLPRCEAAINDTVMSNPTIHVNYWIGNNVSFSVQTIRKVTPDRQPTF